MPSPLPEPSLGATILASGIVQKPRPAANDALAPIRRMTQAEKIAFFSQGGRARRRSNPESFRFARFKNQQSFSIC